LPAPELYLALHTGEMFYGNIGASDRLDFTVVGPAVNEVARMAALCRAVDQPIILSNDFVAGMVDGRDWLAGLGRYALRGVGRPQPLHTLDTVEWLVQAQGAAD
jgi:adenylate cyclase